MIKPSQCLLTHVIARPLSLGLGSDQAAATLCNDLRELFEQWPPYHTRDGRGVGLVWHMNLNVGRFYLQRRRFCFFVFVFESLIIMGQDDRKGEGGVLSVAADAPVREGKETLILFVCIQRRWGDKGEYSSRRINNCYSAPRGSLYRKHRHCPKSLLAVLILIYF